MTVLKTANTLLESSIEKIKGVYNMSIVIGADAAGLRLKEVVKDFLEKKTSTLWMLQLKVKTLLM